MALIFADSYTVVVVVVLNKIKVNVTILLLLLFMYNVDKSYTKLFCLEHVEYLFILVLQAGG